eukprot:gnl/TRDRNA2_/TRDRNA2_167720_c0_seq5.p3 gnl/TRDRNA2_/TRDRNA2_167720_c0~~gnl/TRDRNA2_/TRDRNA2_167720_c0_seq5.p3  ORF type:complete len:112 (-),score=25.15 gnl/TRDRNA2_/TRDRNA2_167720_c0_seq5:288-623(-)
MASACHLHLAQKELEEAFYATVAKYCGPASGTVGEETLVFELFVELLLETARRQYVDLPDAEGVATLFEVHLLPLAKQLSDLDGSDYLLRTSPQAASRRRPFEDGRVVAVR